MQIIIKEPTKEALEKNGWDYRGSISPLYSKKVNNYSVCVRLSALGLPHECWVLFERTKVVTPDDLIAIGNELKKLEAKNDEKD